MASEELGHPKSEAITINRGELEAAFARWDAESAQDDSGDGSPAGKAAYFFRVLIEGKGRKPA